MTVEIGFILILWASAMMLTLVGTWLAQRQFNQAPPHLDQPFALYPVSILKPVKGVENGIRENLETFFKQDYPDYELIFSVADKKDPACRVIRELIKAHPEADARLIIGDIEAGPNPKVNNLIKSYEAAKHDWVLISDSNVRASTNYLRRLVAHLETGVGMVTSIVAGCSPRGLGGYLEAAVLNTFYARGMILAAASGRPCVIGKSMLFRRSVAERFGGIRVLARYLAEDYMAGEAMRRLGLRVVVAVDPVNQHIDRYEFKAFWSRQIRWGRIRKAQAPIPFLLELLGGSLMSGLLGAWAFHKGFGVAPSTFMALHLGIWSACDFSIMRRMEPRMTFYEPIAWFLRELISVPLWVVIASGNTVNWRGKQLTLQPGGVLETSHAVRKV